MSDWENLNVVLKMWSNLQRRCSGSKRLLWNNIDQLYDNWFVIRWMVVCRYKRGTIILSGELNHLFYVLCFCPLPHLLRVAWLVCSSLPVCWFFCPCAPLQKMFLSCVAFYYVPQYIYWNAPWLSECTRRIVEETSRILGHPMFNDGSKLKDRRWARRLTGGTLVI